MKTIINLLAGFIFLINTSFANEINYKLNLTNISFTSEKTLEFDIYLMSAGKNPEIFRYAMGQYFLDVNPGLANSGVLTYSILKSELPESMLPSGVAVSGNQLRLALNPVVADNSIYPAITGDAPGLLIVRMKLETSADKFDKENFEIKWSDDENNFRTKIVAFTEDKLVEISGRSDVNKTDKLSNGEFKILNDLPTEYSLSQNYPNPFNPSTVIRYSIIESGFTNLKIYDLTGRQIATLVSEKQNPGRYEIKFDGSSFASGIYFYKISSGSFSSVKRMLLIK